MKVINDLIAVEVPMGSQVKISGTNWLCHDTDKYPGVWNALVQLPFPAEIIGLASEIEGQVGKELQVLKAADWLGSSIYRLMAAHSITTTTPTTDIIFLRKK